MKGIYDIQTKYYGWERSQAAKLIQKICIYQTTYLKYYNNINIKLIFKLPENTI